MKRIPRTRLDEASVIRRIRRWCPTASSAIIHGIGDDAAVIQPSPGRDLLLTTDLLVETVDFDFPAWTLDRLGAKALLVNLSDIAAMGGRPTVFFVGLAMPKRTAAKDVEDLYRGMGRIARRYRVALGGGDLSSSPSGWSIGITLLGEIDRGRALTRSGAKPGDWLCVTGTLGDSGAGLDALRTHPIRRGSGAVTRPVQFLIDRHQVPTPRVDCGRALAARRLATAAIDLSDGLASDLRRLCEASGVGAEIDLRSIPVSRALKEFTESSQRDPIDYALTGGEDFELLFTVAPATLNRALRLATEKVPITPIGRILPRRTGLVVIDRRGTKRPLKKTGYDHFS